jgi:hypothetical protein
MKNLLFDLTSQETAAISGGSGGASNSTGIDNTVAGGGNSNKPIRTLYYGVVIP